LEKLDSIGAGLVRARKSLGLIARVETQVSFDEKRGFSKGEAPWKKLRSSFDCVGGSPQSRRVIQVWDYRQPLFRKSCPTQQDQKDRSRSDQDQIDVVLIARPASGQATTSEIGAALEALFDRAQLWLEQKDE